MREKINHKDKEESLREPGGLPKIRTKRIGLGSTFRLSPSRFRVVNGEIVLIDLDLPKGVKKGEHNPQKAT